MTKPIRVSCLFAFIIISSTFLWIELVNPYPDRDSVSQFYFPLLNSLNWMQFFGFDLSFQLSNFTQKDYPAGFLFLSLMIHLLGFEEYFLRYPYHIQLVLCLPLIHIIFRLQKGSSNKYIWVCASLLLNPFTLYCFRSFSLQSFNVIFAISSILLFDKFIQSKKISDLFFALIYALIAISFKHLGLIILLSYFLYLIVFEKQSQSIWLALPLIIGAIFYNPYSISRYWEHTHSHNPEFDWIIWILIFCLGYLIFWILERNDKSSVMMAYPATFCSLLVLIILLVPFLALDQSDSNNLLLMTTLLGLWTHFDLRKVNHTELPLLFNKRIYSFAILFFYIACFFYFSLIGKVLFIFFPSGILLSFTLASLNKKVILALLFLIANLFPGLEELENLFGHRGVTYYANGMNALHINFWSWQNCKFKESKESLLNSLQYSTKEDDSIMLISHGLHPHLVKSLEVPPQFIYPIPHFIRLDQIPRDQLQIWKKMILQSEIESIIIEAKVPLIITNSKSIEEQIDDINPVNIEALIATIPEEEIGLFISSLYAQKIVKNPEFKHFYREVANQENSWRAYLHISYYENKHSYSLKKLMTLERNSFYAETKSETENDKVFSKEIWTENKVRAAELFLESNKYFESDPKKCYEMLLKILELDPEHKGAIEDEKVLKNLIKNVN